MTTDPCGMPFRSFVCSSSWWDCFSSSRCKAREARSPWIRAPASLAAAVSAKRLSGEEPHVETIHPR
jgi:hypothetical protein